MDDTLSTTEKAATDQPDETAEATETTETSNAAAVDMPETPEAAVETEAPADVETEAEPAAAEEQGEPEPAATDEAPDDTADEDDAHVSGISGEVSLGGDAADEDEDDLPAPVALGDGDGDVDSDDITIKESPSAGPAGQTTAAAVAKAEANAEAATKEGAKKARVPRHLRKRWFIVHTYSGHENKVKINLERRIESMNMSEKIFRVEVPQKTVTKIKDGRRSEKEERIFPGYVLVEMLMDDDSWYVVRHTPGVTKFVGSQKKPIPAKDSEIKRILMRSAPVAAKVEIDLKVGEVVKIISGPFADFEGTVTEVSPEKERLKASVSIFGRETPVELAFNQVQKSS